jgi:hypothetical protein
MLFLLAALSAPSAPSAPSGGAARAYVGTLKLNVSDNLPHTDSVLPFFKFMNSGNEGGVGYSFPPTNIPNPAMDGLADTLPDYMLNESHVMDDLRDRQLPWRTKDGWTMDRTERDVQVATLENDVLRIDVTPIWGGRIHRALHKPTGRYLSSFNTEHQSVNDGVLRSCELGGIEWNWSPGMIGHTVYSENPVYVAKLQTSRGDALRVYEYDRWNGTVWQVDLHLRGAALWAHVRLINPTDVDLVGYWWTNVQMPMTSSTSKAPEKVGGQRCKPKDPSWPGSRVISPAWGAATGLEIGGVTSLSLVQWPSFTEGCCGYQTSMPGSLNGRPISGPADMSWLSNFSADADVFLQLTDWNRTHTPFIAIADRDIWGDSNGVLHGHGTKFNKIWTMGMDDAHAWTETEATWNGCFVELQVGVAPTQSHTFPLPARTSHHHSEWWMLLDELDNPERLYHDNYSVAVGALADYLNSPKGVPAAAYDDMDAFMKSVSEQPIGSVGDILFNASAYGALDAELTGAANPESVRFFSEPRTLPGFEGEDVTAWAELLRDGTFSQRTLELVPRSFVAGARGAWLTRIVASAEKHGWTWLHHLHVAFEAVERFDLPAARAHYNASLALKVSAHALRGLALLAEDPSQREALFAAAWHAAVRNVKEDDPSAFRLRTSLAGELAFSLRHYASDRATPPAAAKAAWASLDKWISEFDQTFGGVGSLGTTAAGGELAAGRAAVALDKGDWNGAISALESTAFAHYYHGPRPTLEGMWLQAQVGIEEAAKGAPLTAIERKRVKFDKKRAPPNGLGKLNRPVFWGPADARWP